MKEKRKGYGYYYVLFAIVQVAKPFVALTWNDPISLKMNV